MTKQKKIHRKISYLANYDNLTGLINRVTLKARIEEALLIAKQQNKRLAIFFIDLEGFKAINDCFGHDKGDEVLKAAANNLRNSVREDDIVARLGGNEFLVLLPNIGDKLFIIPIVEKIMQQLQQTVSDNKVSLSVTSSIGIAFYPDNGMDYEQLLNHADKAMFTAKKRGRNQYAFYGD